MENGIILGSWGSSRRIAFSCHLWIPFSKIDPHTGATIKTLTLPTGGGEPQNTSYNGFNATPDGTLVMKSVYRQAGCNLQGPDALLDCPDPTDVPASI